MRFEKNRRDHYLPRGYLRGFIDPSRKNHQRPLWHYDIPNGVWSERSPREVGFRIGFYDFATAESGLEHADTTFGELERTFPALRQELISNNFRNWKDHRDFLLRYIQMIRARGLLFFDQKHAEGRALQTWVIEEISPDRRIIKVRSIVPEPPSEAFIRNRALAEMRAEIKKGAAGLNDFNWALRLCESVADPFIISEIPFMAFGPSATSEEAMRHPETLLFFPLCWQACIIGSRQFFDDETGVLGQEDMQRARKMYREKASLFVLSPTKLDF